MRQTGNRQPNLPGTLPMLPGNVYADPTVTRYHKTQLLGIKDNTICGKLNWLRAGFNLNSECLCGASNRRINCRYNFSRFLTLALFNLENRKDNDTGRA